MQGEGLSVGDGVLVDEMKKQFFSSYLFSDFEIILRYCTGISAEPDTRREPRCLPCLLLCAQAQAQSGQASRGERV